MLYSQNTSSTDTDQRPSTGTPNSIIEPTFYVLGEEKHNRFLTGRSAWNSMPWISFVRNDHVRKK